MHRSTAETAGTSDAPLAVVEQWHRALNEASARGLARLTADPVDVLGPRGTGKLTGDELGAWMVRSGFSASPTRWFCGGNGRVVVEQDARWIDAETGAVQSRAVVASHFGIADGLVTAIARHTDLAEALDAAGLTEHDLVTTRR